MFSNSSLEAVIDLVGQIGGWDSMMELSSAEDMEVLHFSEITSESLIKQFRFREQLERRY